MSFFYFRLIKSLLIFLFLSSYSLAAPLEEDIIFSQDLGLKRQSVIDQLKDSLSPFQDSEQAPSPPSPAPISIDNLTFYGLEDVGLTVEGVLQLIRCSQPVANLRLSRARLIPIPCVNTPLVDLDHMPAPKPKKKRRRWFFFGPRG